MDTLHYCYERSTGAFAGSGVTPIDTDTHASTTVAPPNVDASSDNLTWTGTEWVVTPRSPVVANLITGLAAVESIEAVREAAINATGSAP